MLEVQRIIANPLLPCPEDYPFTWCGYIQYNQHISHVFKKEFAMSEQHHDFPKTTPAQVILATVGGLFAPVLALFLVAKLVIGIQDSHLEDTEKAPEQVAAVTAPVEAAPAAETEQPAEAAPEDAAPVAEEKVEPPAAPVAQAEPVKEAPKAVAAAPKPEATPAPAEEKPAEAAPEAKTAGKSGEDVFKSVCSMCHGVGLMGAPKVGDHDAWGPRIAQGQDTLVQHAIKGIRMMPAKGGNPGLSDAEVTAAVIYMANQSGASFK
jgi:cytochrome c5